MKLSRVVKYKEYRDSFTKEDTPNIGAKDIISGFAGTNDFISTTNTLPYEEVMQEVVTQREALKELRKIKFKRGLIIFGIVFACVVVIIGLIFLGILAFKK